MTVTQSPVTHSGDLVTALLGVPGVAAAAVEPGPAGPGTLRLQLLPGADEVGVAGAVNRILRSRFGLAVDADRVRVLGETAANSATTPNTALHAPVETEPEETPQPGDEAAAPAAAPAGPSPVPLPDVPPTSAAEREAMLRAAGWPEVGARAAVSAHPPAAPTSVAPTVPLPSVPLPSVPLPPATQPPAALPAAAVPTVELRTGTPRLVIERVQLVSTNLSTTVTVSLSADGRLVEGTAEGTATAASLHRSVAVATLRAVESVVGDDARFDVDHVEIARTGTDRTALVVLTMVTERSTQRLSGASVVREDVRQAVIRAVLAAVNRRLEPLIDAAGPATA